MKEKKTQDRLPARPLRPALPVSRRSHDVYLGTSSPGPAAFPGALGD